MERTEYINDTRPTQTQLNNTEDAKVNAILRRQRATAQLGTVIGFQTIPNSVNALLIDIGPGEGYTGGMYTQLNVKAETSAERIASDTNIVTAQALVDYTNGTKNYVSIVYSETTDTPIDEIYYPFVAHDTLVHEAYSVSVLTEANWNLLTLTQLRLRILVAIVTARGAGVPLTASDIQQVVQPKNLPITTQPVNITGTTANSVTDSTAIGAGTLRWDVTTHKIYWTAPGDTEGVGVSIIVSGSYTLYSANISFWIVVYAVSAALPATSQTDIIYVQSMYGTIFPRYSAVDGVHREMLGHGVASINNPHALSDVDITGLGFDHAALFHKNGISILADSSQLNARIDPDPTYDQILVRNLGGRLNSFLISGSTYTDILGISSGSDAVVSFDTVPPISGEYMIYLDDAANLQSIFVGTALWSVNIYLVDMKNTTAGAGAVITWDSVAKTLTYAAPGEAAGTAVYLMGYDGLVGYYGYYKLYSATTTNWVIVYVGGTLGGNNSTTFATAKSETNNADGSILKICVVNWDLATEILSNLRDIRQWGSADWRDKILEEHDENGHHNKVFQSPIRAIAITGPAISAYAVNGAALALGAPNTAVLCQADTAVGVMGSAASIGVYGVGSAVVGVGGIAPNTAASFSAASSYGIVAIASANIAASFSAQNTALIVQASAAIGGSFSAANTAVKANASVAQAVFASAPNSAIVASASVAQAVYASAPNTAIYAIASVAQAIKASAPNSAIVVNASVAQAIYASAPNTALYVIATNQKAIFTSASAYAVWAEAQDTAIFGSAISDAVGGTASAYGIWGGAVNTGVFGTATDCAVFGAADTHAIYGEATNHVIAAVVVGGGNGTALLAQGGACAAHFLGNHILLDLDSYNTAGAVVSYIHVKMGNTDYRLALCTTP